MDIEKRKPDFVVITSREVAAFTLPEGGKVPAGGRLLSTRVERRMKSGFAGFLAKLRGGELGYVLAHRGDFRLRFFREISSLNISPEFVEVYRRVRE